MLLLHISDIHLKHPLCQTKHDPELYFRQELVTHASTQASHFGDVDAILVTGDVAFRGLKEEYDCASAWLEELANAVGCNKRRIYVVPGNHDVDRSVFGKDIAARNAIKAIATASGNQAREKELIVQLGGKNGERDLFASIANFNFFAAKYDCQYDPHRLFWSTTLRIDRRTVLRLYGLNSTLISGVDGTDHKGTLFMGPPQLNVPRAPGTVNLVMAHHPPEWMSDQQEVETRLFGTPNIVLFGHNHVQKLRRDVNGPMVFFAGSVNPDRHESGWEPAYNFVELKSSDRDNRRSVEVAVFQYHWQSNPNGFVAKIDIDTEAREEIFRHSIAIQGEDNELVPEAPVIQVEGGEDMDKQTKLDYEEAQLAAPNVRDLIYRFWELDRHQRDAILGDLGIGVGGAQHFSEPTAYRRALVKLARQNRLSELASAIAVKESAS